MPPETAALTGSWAPDAASSAPPDVRESQQTADGGCHIDLVLPRGARVLPTGSAVAARSDLAAGAFPGAVSCRRLQCLLLQMGSWGAPNRRHHGLCRPMTAGNGSYWCGCIGR